MQGYPVLKQYWIPAAKALEMDNLDTRIEALEKRVLG
jgi:hypothetical protein